MVEKQMNKVPIEYIDRDLAELALFEAENECAGMDEKTVEKIFALAKNKLDSVKKADVEPVVRSRWRYFKKRNKAVCTNCSFERYLDENFGASVACPNCGARMDGDSNA